MERGLGIADENARAEKGTEIKLKDRNKGMIWEGGK